MSETLEEKQYWSLLESTQEHVYPDFVQRLRRQEGPFREEGKAAVMEFWDGATPSIQPSVPPLGSSRALRRVLNKVSNGSRRRIIVLEGLPRNYIQVIGAKLRVPPDFFAAHWVSPAFSGNLVNRTPRGYDSKNRFMLSFPKIHQATVAAHPGDGDYPFYYMDSTLRRILSRVTVFRDTDGPMHSSEQVSFWSTSDGDNWDGVLLVDPALGDFVRWRTSPTPRQVQRIDSIQATGSAMAALNQSGSWYPPIVPSEKPLPSASSTFDILLTVYPSSQRTTTSDPNSCMDYCRSLVLSAWTARIRIVETQLIKEQLMLSIGDIPAGARAAEVFEKSWQRPWHPRDFGRLVRAKSALESIDWELRRNMDALGIGSESKRTAEAWEADAWQSLREVIKSLKIRLDIMLQAYMQSISVRETSAANKQARQVGYLTSLATIFIPLSFVAAIFSMGGDFSAGSDRFWVYWVVAVPVAAIGCLLLFTKLGRRVIQRVSKAESPV